TLGGPFTALGEASSPPRLPGPPHSCTALYTGLHTASLGSALFLRCADVPGLARALEMSAPGLWDASSRLPFEPPVHARPARPVLHAGRTRMGERVRPAFFVPCRRRQARGILRGSSWIRAMLRVLLLIGLLLAGLGGCAPSVTPLYRDYEVRLTTEADTGRADTFARIRAALRSAGWEEAESEAPNVVATAPR